MQVSISYQNNTLIAIEAREGSEAWRVGSRVQDPGVAESAYKVVGLLDAKPCRRFQQRRMILSKTESKEVEQNPFAFQMGWLNHWLNF